IVQPIDQLAAGERLILVKFQRPREDLRKNPLPRAVDASVDQAGKRDVVVTGGKREQNGRDENGERDDPERTGLQEGRISGWQKGSNGPSSFSSLPFWCFCHSAILQLSDGDNPVFVRFERQLGH